MWKMSDTQKAICKLLGEITPFSEKDIVWLLTDTQSLDDTLVLMEQAASTGKSLYAVAIEREEKGE